MTLSQAKLADLFKSLAPTSDYTLAAARIVDGFEAYFAEASVLGLSIGSVALLAPARAAMSAALLPAMAPRNNAAGALQAGIVGWWGAIPALAAALWVDAPPLSPPIIGATVPPGLGSITASLNVVFAVNRAASRNRNDAADATAAVLHPLMLGAFVSLGPPPSTSAIL